MKGLAHVGAISVVERFGLRPDVIAGCSIGAVIGAFYAAGFTAPEMAALLGQRNLLGLFSLRLDGEGLLGVGSLGAFLRAHLGSRRIEDLDTPFVVVCTDLETGAEVNLDSGPLVEAVLASAAIPGLFAPVTIGDRMLVDGGLSNNLPVSVLERRGARFTIGIRLFWQSSAWEITPTQEEQGAKGLMLPDDLRAPRPAPRGRARLAYWAERMAGRVMDRLPHAFSVLQRSLDLVVMQNEAAQLRACPPDVLIAPEVTDIGILDFHQDKELVLSRGVDAAAAQGEALLHLAARLEHARRQAQAAASKAPPP